MNKHRLDPKVIARKLDQAMKEQEVGVRRLSEQIQEKLGVNAPGTTYGALQLYRKARVYRPRVDVLEATAEVLGLRPEWLIWDEGEATDVEEYARREDKAARERLDRKAEERLSKRLEEVLCEELPRFKQGALKQTWSMVWHLSVSWLTHANLFLRHPDLVQEMLTGEPGVLPVGSASGAQELAVREVARLLRAPADVAGIRLESLSDHHLDLYVGAARTAILTLITDPERLKLSEPRPTTSAHYAKKED